MHTYRMDFVVVLRVTVTAFCGRLNSCVKVFEWNSGSQSCWRPGWYWYGPQCRDPFGTDWVLVTQLLESESCRNWYRWVCVFPVVQTESWPIWYRLNCSVATGTDGFVCSQWYRLNCSVETGTDVTQVARLVLVKNELLVPICYGPNSSDPAGADGITATQLIAEWIIETELVKINRGVSAVTASWNQKFLWYSVQHLSPYMEAFRSVRINVSLVLCKLVKIITCNNTWDNFPLYDRYFCTLWRDKKDFIT